ncbi:MAG: GFA family protein [Polyangiaceae bacterium]
MTAPPLMTSACHCTGCQRMSSSAYSLSAAFPASNFAVIRGTPVLGGLRKGTHHLFCPSCKSWMFTRPEGMDEFVNVRTPMLDDTSGLEPFVETYMREKLPWITPTASRTYETFPEMEAYPSLLAAYAAYRASK